LLYVALGIALLIAVAVVGLRPAVAGLIFRIGQIGAALVGIVCFGLFVNYVLPIFFMIVFWTLVVGGSAFLLIAFLKPQTEK